MEFKCAVAEAVKYLDSVGVSAHVEFKRSKVFVLEVGSFNYAIITPVGFTLSDGRPLCWYVSDTPRHYKKLLSRVKRRFPQKNPD